MVIAPRGFDWPSVKFGSYVVFLFVFFFREIFISLDISIYLKNLQFYKCLYLAGFSIGHSE